MTQCHFRGVMKLGILHIHEDKMPEEIDIIKELLATAYSMRISLKINHTEAEIRAENYLKKRGYENK